ncbi:MAG: L-threonine 3-dehydrogenase [Planctomycetes bacterium]|nr:L-threonine 3-dehydrogenase [Planctomycetota bacterium]
MKAIVKARAEPGLKIQDAPDPAPPGPGEALIRIRAGSICGTDLHIHKWDAWAQSRIRPPQIIGHEIAGDIVELGEGVEGYEKGQTVSVEGHIVCGRCPLCRTGQAHICPRMEIIGIDRDGGFAEYIKVPASNLWKIDAGIPIEVAALHDALGNAFHATLLHPVAGKSVLVLGCGPIGLLSCAIARASGAERVFATDVNPRRLDIAERMGADVRIDASKQDPVRVVREATESIGADVVLEMSGAPSAIQQGLAAVRNGGEVRLLGLPAHDVPIALARDIIFKGITIHGILGRRMYETWYQMRAFLRAGRIDVSPVITHRLPYQDVDKGFAALGEGTAGKVVLRFDA